LSPAIDASRRAESIAGLKPRFERPGHKLSSKN
jgi:hypothetical protein